MLIRVVADPREDAQVRVAGVVDEARGAREVLAVDLERGPAKPRVVAGGGGEFVKREEIDVLMLRDGGGCAALVGFVGRDDLADILVDELPALDGEAAVDAWRWWLASRISKSKFSIWDKRKYSPQPRPSVVRNKSRGILRPRSTTRLRQSALHPQPLWHS